MKQLRQLKAKDIALDLLAIVLGSIAFALAYDIFLEPNSIAPGGVSGLAMVIESVFPYLSIGALIVLLNAPLFLLGWKVEGRFFLIKSLIGTLLSSLFIDLLAGRWEYTDDPIMAALFGGVLLGAGLGVILVRGATTGGSDIAAKLLVLKFPSLSVGRLMLVVDTCVILLAAAVFGHINYALYALVSLYVSTVVIDGIVYGTDSAQVAYIITSKTDEIVSAIDTQLDRGATLLQGEGSYTHRPMQVILCAIHRRQIGDLKRICREIDPASFVIITETHEVLGDGFRRHGS